MKTAASATLKKHRIPTARETAYRNTRAHIALMRERLKPKIRIQSLEIHGGVIYAQMQLTRDNQMTTIAIQIPVANIKLAEKFALEVQEAAKKDIARLLAGAKVEG